MAANIVQTPGDRINFTLSSTVASGAIVDILGGAAGAAGVAIKGGVSGDVVPIQMRGAIARLTAKTADTVAVGDKLYHDGTNDQVTVTATSNEYIGRATTAKAGSAAGTVDVLLGAA